MFGDGASGNGDQALASPSAYMCWSCDSTGDSGSA